MTANPEQAGGPAVAARDTADTGLSRARRAAWWATLWLYLIVITGVTVRLTGSGLGCPDWPTCEGLMPVEAYGFHAAIEFANRLVALPTLAATLWMLVAAWRVAPARWDLRLASAAALLAVLGNIALGALTILRDLDPVLVSNHFLMSMESIGAAVLCLYAAGQPQSLGRRWSRSRVRLLTATTLLLTAGVTIVGGVLTTATGPHSGGSPEQVIERLDLGWAIVAFHARAAYVFLGAVAVAWWLDRRRQGSATNLAILLGLCVVQITLGEIQYRTGLPRGIVLAHVACAAGIWLQTCRVVARLAWPSAGQGISEHTASHRTSQQAVST